MNRGLRSFELWMLREIERPLDPRRLPRARRARIEREVLPSATLGAVERLALYSELVHARLVECLRGDFPATQRALGAARFERLASRFLERHPSRHFSLNQLGAAFPAFLARVRCRGALVDLARLERTVQDVFDAPRDDVLRLESLRAWPPERWGSLKLRPIRALRIVRAASNANTYLQAFHDGRRASLARRTTHTLVWRSEFVVWRRELSQREHALLARVVAGESLAACLRDVPMRGSSAVRSWFETWARDGLFRALES